MPARAEWPPPRLLAWLYAPPAQRQAFAALCSIESEIAASLAPGLDHQVAHTRLSWWREECRRASLGQAAHPLTRELSAGLASLGEAPLASLAGLAEAAVWDLAGATFDTRSELAAYCELWSAALFEPLARHAQPATAAAAWRPLGRALKELELLAALARDARAGRLRLPLDELAHAGVAPQTVAEGRWPEPLAQLVGARHRALQAALAERSAALAPAEQGPLRGLLVWVTLAAGYSRRAERALPQAAPARGLQAPLDGWRAWRVARRAVAGRFALRAP